MNTAGWSNTLWNVFTIRKPCDDPELAAGLAG